MRRRCIPSRRSRSLHGSRARADDDDAEVNLERAIAALMIREVRMSNSSCERWFAINCAMRCGAVGSQRTLFFALLSDGLLRFSGSDAKAILSLTTVVLIVIPLVTLVLSTIYVYNAREFTEAVTRPTDSAIVAVRGAVSRAHAASGRWMKPWQACHCRFSSAGTAIQRARC